jgi:hypothetical protein
MKVLWAKRLSLVSFRSQLAHTLARPMILESISSQCNYEFPVGMPRHAAAMFYASAVARFDIRKETYAVWSVAEFLHDEECDRRLSRSISNSDSVGLYLLYEADQDSNHVASWHV